MSRVSGLVERVRLMVLRGEIPAGGRIVELHLAEVFGVSRSTVREVLRQLEGDGLVVANGSGGMRVVRLGAEELADTLKVRAALEALSAGLAAERVADGRTAPAALGALAGLADAALDASATDSAVVADRAFHRGVGALAANGPCCEALDRIWDRLVVVSLQSPLPQPREEVADREHCDLLAAIGEGDPEAASAVARRHVLATLA